MPWTAAAALGLVLAQAAPEPSPAPLPEGNAYVRALVARQRHREQVLNDYTYDIFVAEEDLEKDGRVKQRKTRQYESFFVKGRSVRRQVAENGKPLDAKRQAEEDKRTREHAEAIAAGKVAVEQPRVRISEILERYDFTAVGREPVDGRPAVVLEFKPLPGKRDIKGDNVLRTLTGRIWVDEAEQEVARAQLRNTAPVKFAGGLGASLHTLESLLEYRKVDDRVWLPLKEETTATGRILLLKSFRKRFSRTYSRYRRFQVEAEETVRQQP
jgi:hypothetical protein